MLYTYVDYQHELTRFFPQMDPLDLSASENSSMSPLGLPNLFSEVPKSPALSVASSSSNSSLLSFVLSSPSRGDDPSVFIVDTSVATLVLDGEAWKRDPIDCIMSISGLGSAMQRITPGQTPEIAIPRLRKGLAALEWYHSIKPNIKITRTVLSELKSSSQVEWQCLIWHCKIKLRNKAGTDQNSIQTRLVRLITNASRHVAASVFTKLHNAGNCYFYYLSSPLPFYVCFFICHPLKLFTFFLWYATRTIWSVQKWYHLCSFPSACSCCFLEQCV